MLRLGFVLIAVQAALGLGVGAQIVGNLTLLSYNVAGLPELLSSGNPAVNTPLISPRLKSYNIINVQEDFNYHAALYASDNHAFRTPTSGGAGIGSGLNTLSDFPYIDFERVKWSDCNLSGGDCITPKGFTFARVRVADGAWIDVYNMHTDAGSESGDIAARAKNFAQVTAYIATWSAGMPVVVMGDTNARYTRPGDGETLRSFLASTGAVDLWVSKVRGGNPPAVGTDALVCPFPFAVGTKQEVLDACETVDKIFVRPSAALTFPAATFANAHDVFVDGKGAPLSDHYPMSGTVAWKLSSSIRLGDTIGGPHGTAFNDIPSLLSGAIPKLTSITIRGANRVDGLAYSVKYPSGSSSTASHGGTGGTANTLSLPSGERVVKVKACSGKYNNTTRIFYLELTTNTGRTISAGKTTSDCLTTTVPVDAGSPGSWGLVAFWGRDGNEVDRIAPIWGAAY
ncbi:Sphingomyelinase [Psilocybe cubensis]|uniref:Sphingomyelinase n=2 Tax=Psilocybe cubensis TaxID=181762 RepID=A0ACB8H9R6_PSICU|nr:Sphingomyelinase [Psilocybe cubensis]KAH9484470.1 Sphingomyelinase [Psilocybe cubensis]